MLSHIGRKEEEKREGKQAQQPAVDIDLSVAVNVLL